MRVAGKIAVNPAAPAYSRHAVVLDACERAVVSAIFVHFAWLMLSQGLQKASLLAVLLVISEAFPFVLILLRTKSETLSQRPTDWLLGITGTTLPLLVRPAVVAPLVAPGICFALMLLGIATQLAAKAVLGRNFGIVAANRGVVTLGPYRFIRHPMYLGYSITHISFLLSMPSAATAMLYATTLGVQVMRILREEQVLMRDAAYRTFADRVRFRLLPGVF